MNKHSFKINFAHCGQGTKVEMDGKPVHGLRSVSVSTEVHTPTTLVLEFTGVEVEVTGEGEVLAREEAREPFWRRWLRAR